MSLIAAETNWNQIKSDSRSIVVTLQGWINDSGLIIVEIPYFCLNDTKFVQTY